MSAAVSNPLLQALPGSSLPVAQVSKQLASLWDPEPGSTFETVSDFRASQLNLILYLGQETTPDDAVAQFNTALHFAQRYPCRIIVLSPNPQAGAADADSPMTGKLFSQCYIGAEGQDMVCCEALMLGFDPAASGFLENQVTVWLEADLPVYFWMHRANAASLGSGYSDFLGKCRRVVYDQAIDPAWDGLNLLREECRRDLAYCRLLPMRQAIGQYLSNFDPAILVHGLERIETRAGSCRAGEARALGQWAAERLAKCAALTGNAVAQYEHTFVEEEDRQHLAFELIYAEGKQSYRLCADFSDRHSQITAQLGGHEESFTLRARLLEPHQALAEAFFF